MKQLAEKKDMKAKKPVFKRQDSHKQSKKCQSWRKPRGYQSKVRLQKRGYRRKVKVGYGTPAALKHVSLDGLKRVKVDCLADLKKINKETECALLASSLGTRMKIIILSEAVKQNIKIANVKDVPKFMEQVKSKLADKKEMKKKREAKKEAKEKELKAEAEKKEKEGKKDLDKKLEDQEEKKKEEKKEKDKILTQKAN